MRIALFTDSFPPDINGVATATQTLFEALKAHGHNVYVVTANHYGKKVEFKDNILRIPGIELKKLYSLILTGPINPKATRIIKQWKLDIIHIHTEAGMGWYGRNLAHKFKIPLIYTYHTMYVDYTYYVTKGFLDPWAKSIMKIWSRVITSQCTELTTPSYKTRNALREYGNNKYINVIPNGINLSMYEEKNVDKEFIAKFKKEHNLENKYILLSLGRIAKEKGIDVLLKGYRNFLNTTPSLDTVLLIVGGGPAKEELEHLAYDLGIANKVLFTGNVPHEQVPCYYWMSDLFLSASITETQGLTYIEAMASKTLVLCRFDENLQEVVKDGITGFYFSDETSFTKRLTEIINMPKEAKDKIIETAYEANKQYSMDTFYERMIEVYNRGRRKLW
jgi:1,2-diacylglycerol 3-alpha-glucosyltransferase